MNKKKYNKLFWRKVMKPTLLIGGIPLVICWIIGGVLFVFYNSFNGIYLISFSSLYMVLVIIIGIGAGGLDFTNKYGYEEDSPKE